MTERQKKTWTEWQDLLTTEELNQLADALTKVNDAFEKRTGEVLIEVQNHINSHIRQWRENHNHEDKFLRQRAIDATDALQQLRKSIFGEILPQDDGTYKVFTQDGESWAQAPDVKTANEIYANAPTGSQRRFL